MKIKHTGLVATKEENADTFYRDLLGLTKNDPRILSANLVKAIFNIDAEIKLVNYTKGDVHFEIFIYPVKKETPQVIEHACLEVENRDAFLKKCKDLHVKILEIQKDQKTLFFIRDFDDHLFEIKEQ